MTRPPPTRLSPRPLSIPALLVLLAGCGSPSPFAQETERDLRNSVQDATRRELGDPALRPAPRVTERVDLSQQLGIKPETIVELEKTAGPSSYDWATLSLGNDLLGQPPRTVTISLERAVRMAMEHNIAVQFARLSPAVSEAQVIAAEAAFDWALFSNFNFNSIDSPRVSSTFSGTSSPVFSDQSETTTGTLGLRRTLVGGGRLTAQLDQSFADNNTPGLNNSPNPAHSAAFVLQYDQPLLRNAGSEVSQAEIRVARNAERGAVQTLRRDMIRVATDTERTYWQLVQATYDVMILQRLLERGETVRGQLEQRTAIDANQAQIADSRARVERRRADVQRARTQVNILSDQLKSLVNDPQLPVGSEITLLPADRPADQPVRFSLLESLRQAVTFRPEVQQAILGIDDASIRQTVARNGRLPDLAARFQVRFANIDNNVGETYGGLFDGQFVDYVFGLAFEQPIGNRRAQAELRRRRLERQQTVLAYRNSIVDATRDVKAALHRVVLNYDLIAQTRTSRLAASELYRVLLVEKDILSTRSVERLDFELRREEELSNAEREEVAALVDYNIAIAELFAAMGTSLERNNVRLVVPTSDQVVEDIRRP